MKQGALLNKIMILVLFGAIVLYMGFYAIDALSDPFTLMKVYECTLDDTMEATGFLVREEHTLEGEAPMVDLLFTEGEKVARGETVALLYNSAEAEHRREQLQGLALERDQLEYVLSSESQTGGSNEIIDILTGLKGAVARGNLTRLEEQTLELKRLIYQRAEHVDKDSSDEALRTRLGSIESQIEQLKQEAAADTARVVADEPGVFSGLVDGFETVLTPESIYTLTPEYLDQYASYPVSRHEDVPGKLITGLTWYYVAALQEEQADKLTEGEVVQVRFSRDWSGEVPMQVMQLAPPQEGRRVVILASNHALADTTLLRRQSVELVFDSVEGLRIPASALRSVEDPETGKRQPGVYTLSGVWAEFKPVEILTQREDYYVVKPVIKEKDGKQEARKYLRAGDDLIIARQELYDGKVVR